MYPVPIDLFLDILLYEADIKIVESLNMNY